MRNHRKKRLLLLLFVLLLVPVSLHFGKGFLRETLYDYTDHTPAEQAVMAFSQNSGTPYRTWPESLIALLDRNPETEDFVLSYPLRDSLDLTVDLTDQLGSDRMPLFLQWDKRWGYLNYGGDLAALTACGPVCLSMAAFHLKQDVCMSPDRMIRFALEEGYCKPGSGTSWTLISEGAQKLGLRATELPLVKKLIFSHLEHGDPVICVMGPGDFTTTGHYIVLTGLEDGLLRVNDPNSIARSETLWDYDRICDQIRNLWALEVA